MRIAVVIPCFSEEETIADLVTRAKKYVDEVVVADDGSTDKTSQVAWKAGAMVVQSKSRQGFGKNIMMGINTAFVNVRPDIVVTLDGDGQHNPDEIPQVIEPILNGEADLVIGSRFMGVFDVPRYRKFGIDIITWLYNIGHSQKIIDGQSCFRAYKKELLEAITIDENGFGFSTEILIKARMQGFRIMEVPVSCIYHKEFIKNSSMNPVKQGVSVALSTIKWRVRLRNGRNKPC